MATFDDFYNSLDPDVRIRGKQFEKFVKWFLENSKLWSSKIEKVWLWDDYPDKWGTDCGIDLIFKQKNGQIWAVQSKCFAPERDIPKSEIDSFLSESNDATISGRLLISSTDGIGKNAEQVLKRQEKKVVLFLLQNFREEILEFPDSIEDLNKPAKKKVLNPYPHQEEAISSVLKGLETRNKGQVIMACGIGKTLTSFWIDQRLLSQKTLVLVPSLNLLGQTLREWTSAATDLFKWICVCSDSSVTKKDNESDQLIENPSELGVQVTSDCKNISKFLHEDGKKVIFSTYQSSSLVAAAIKESEGFFDLVIADEAHRCAGKVSDFYGLVLDDKKIPFKKKLFFTATPRVFTKAIQNKSKENNFEVASMDNKYFFGDVLFKLNFSNAINRKPPLLTDYQVVVIGVDDELIKEKIIKREFLTTDGIKTFDAETLSTYIALTKSIDKYNLKKIITFHGRVKGAEYFSNNFPHVLEWMNHDQNFSKPLSCSFVSGKIKTSIRNQRIQDLKKNDDVIRILSNARCLSEGVDVPSLDGVAFIDPKRSQIDIIQSVGRAIRKSEHKKVGTIVIPVYIGDLNNLDEEMFESKFSDVWKIILALKSQDDTLMEVIDKLRVELGSRPSGNGGGSSGLEKIIFDLPQKISSRFSSQIQTILVRNTSENWFEMYGRLVQYLDENKYIPPQSYIDTNGVKLGSWVGTQRQRSKILTTEKFDLLDSLEQWNWDEREARWMEGFYELIQFIDKNGHSYPGKKFISKSGYRLGHWIHMRRRDPQSVTDKHKKLLNEIPEWDWRDKADFYWDKYFKELENFTKIHGKAQPPDDFVTDTGFRLGKWVGKQRAKKDSLKPERKKRLLKLNGWLWDAKREIWEKGIKELKIYEIKNGNVFMTNTYVTSDGFKLGSWVQTRRTRRKDLSEARQKELESFNGWTWDKFESLWQAGFYALSEYTKEFGSATPSAKYKNKDGFSLGGWARRQRYNWDDLSKERKELLLNLKGWKEKLDKK